MLFMFSAGNEAVGKDSTSAIGTVANEYLIQQQFQYRLVPQYQFVSLFETLTLAETVMTMLSGNQVFGRLLPPTNVQKINYINHLQ